MLNKYHHFICDWWHRNVVCYYYEEYNLIYFLYNKMLTWSNPCNACSAVPLPFKLVLPLLLLLLLLLLWMWLLLLIAVPLLLLLLLLILLLLLLFGSLPAVGRSIAMPKSGAVTKSKKSVLDRSSGRNASLMSMLVDDDILAGIISSLLSTYVPSKSYTTPARFAQ